jgi:hypothetical protein
MNLNDITVTLTEFQHEIINDLLFHAIESYQLMVPYDAAIDDLPLENEIVQRRTAIENLREMFISLQLDRFENTSD